VLAQTGGWPWYGNKHPIMGRENSNCYKRKQISYVVVSCSIFPDNADLSSETTPYQTTSKKEYILIK